jgi:hypothetical protein
MIQELDDTLLAYAQRASDWFHSWTSLDSIHQTRIAAGLAALAWLLSLSHDLAHHHGFSWIGGLCLISVLYRAVFETKYDSMVRSESARGFRNRHRMGTFYKINRLSILLFTLLILPSLFLLPIRLSLLLTSYTAMYWLEACDPQTPRTGRIRQALRRALTIRMPAPAGAKS